MSGLSAFFADNALKGEKIEYVASKRFLDEKKKPIKWILKTIDSTREEEIRKDCTRRIEINKKRGQYTKEVDSDKFAATMVVECVEFPNLNSKELQDSYGVMSANDLVKKMLLPGEYTNLAEKVQEINGYDITQDELAEDVKN